MYMHRDSRGKGGFSSKRIHNFAVAGVSAATATLAAGLAVGAAPTLAVRWLVLFARQRREKTMAQRLAYELLDATQQQGGAYMRKDGIYRMAQANKAFAHYRW